MVTVYSGAEGGMVGYWTVGRLRWGVGKDEMFMEDPWLDL
jgi:hypothetical protein